MAINFPNSPVNNETYTENGVKWKYNSTYNAWFVIDDNKLLANTSNNQIVYISNDKLVSSNGLVYLETGNVGIGISSPTSNLHVIGTANITGTLIVQGSNIISTIIAAFEQANTGGGGGGTLTTFTSNVGDGSANTFNVSHGLNSFWLLTSVRELSTGDIVYPDMRQTTANNLVITFVDNPTANQYALLVAKVA